VTIFNSSSSTEQLNGTVAVFGWCDYAFSNPSE